MQPDTHTILDPRFRSLVFGHTRLEKLYTGCRWAEGPAYFAAGRYLIWSDIPNDRLLRYDECDGHVSGVPPAGAHNENGHTVDRQGRLISCEHRGRCVSRTEHDGRRNGAGDASRRPQAELAERRGGEVGRHHLVHRPRPMASTAITKATRARARSAPSHVYRFDPRARSLSVVVDDLGKPNGLAFSPDENLLYVGRYRQHHHDPSNTPKICVYPVEHEGDRLGAGRLFSESDAGLYDGPAGWTRRGISGPRPATACIACIRTAR